MTTTPDHTDTSVSRAHAEVRAEIARTDTKTALLLAFVGAALVAVWTAGRDVPMNAAALLLGGAGMTLLVGAAGLLLWSVRPNLHGGHGFPLWATLSPQDLRAELSGDLGADVVGLSRLAVAKFTSLRRAVDLTYASGVLLVLAALAAVGGAV
ncbi:Pycsar system effector family protein [Streptomyces uncialis]|uniref:Pycsar system effector family protein n=1 Tax=Streptomyces uncialis TaxID=1048205 RepID=UPI0038255C32